MSVQNIVQTHENNLIIAGTAESENGLYYQAVVMLCDPEGNPLWQRPLADTEGQTAFRVLQIPDDGYVVEGGSIYHWMLVAEAPGWVSKLDAAGNEMWRKTDDTYALSFPTWIEQTTDGGYVVSGTANGPDWTTSSCAAVTKLDSEGNTVCSR